MIEEIMEYNRRFVAEKGYERFVTDKYPNKRIAWTPAWSSYSPPLWGSATAT